MLTDLSITITPAYGLCIKKGLWETVTPSSHLPPLPFPPKEFKMHLNEFKMLILQNYLSCRQKAEKWEPLRGKGGTKNTEESSTKEDTESPCSQGRNGDIKQFLLLPAARSWALLSSPKAGWCEGSANKRSCVCLCLGMNTRACVGGEDS